MSIFRLLQRHVCWGKEGGICACSLASCLHEGFFISSQLSHWSSSFWTKSCMCQRVDTWSVQGSLDQVLWKQYRLMGNRLNHVLWGGRNLLEQKKRCGPPWAPDSSSGFCHECCPHSYTRHTVKCAGGPGEVVSPALDSLCHTSTQHDSEFVEEWYEWHKFKTQTTHPAPRTA